MPPAPTTSNEASIFDAEEVLTPTETTVNNQELTAAPTPTATPSALLSLRWNMMTVRSPLPLFTSYRFYYPTTWSIKEYKNIPNSKDGGTSTLTLEKGTTFLSILQSSGEASVCLPSLYSDFRYFVKRDIITWGWGKKISADATSAFDVCESLSGGDYTTPASIGFITISSPTDITTETLNEINYILEKIVILK